MLTLLVAHHNQGEFLPRALASVFQQTSPHWRVILCDDGSHLGEWLALQRWAADPRLQLLRNPVPLGYTATLQRMVETATTEFVGILDADDALASQAVELTLEAYEKNPDAGFTYSDRILCDRKLRPITTVQSRPLGSGTTALEGNIVDHFRSFRRSAFFACGGLDPKYEHAEDQDLSYRLDETTKGIYIPQPLYFYRLHPRSASHLHSARSTTHHLLAFYASAQRRQLKGALTHSGPWLLERAKEIRRQQRLYRLPRGRRLLRFALLRLNALIPGLEGRVARAARRAQFRARKFGWGRPHYPRPAWVPCHRHQFAFLDIPKNGSSTLKSLVLAADHGLTHITAITHEVVGYGHDHTLRFPLESFNLKRDWVRFAVYRDPVDRFLSLYRQKILNVRSTAPHPLFLSLGLLGCSLDRFVRFAESELASGHWGRVDPHLTPQHVLLEGARVDYLVPIDELDAFLKVQFRIGNQLRRNSTQRYPSPEVDPRLQERIRRLYERDFELRDRLSVGWSQRATELSLMGGPELHWTPPNESREFVLGQG